MAVTEQERNHLYNTLRERLGDEEAATMMELLAPVGWSDVVRTRDLDGLRHHMDARFEAIDARFESMDARFEAIEARLDQTNRFITWMLASNAGLVAAVTAITSLT